MFADLFRQLYRAPLIMLRALLANPLSVFVYGLMSKWYIMITLASIMVTFWVFKGLEKAGVLEKVESVVSKALVQCKSVAQNCTPLIMDLPATWACVQNPPEYVQNDDEIKLQKNVDDALKHLPTMDKGQDTSPADSPASPQANPYEQ